jgi:hypothetical protein
MKRIYHWTISSLFSTSPCSTSSDFKFRPGRRLNKHFSNSGKLITKVDCYPRYVCLSIYRCVHMEQSDFHHTGFLEMTYLGILTDFLEISYLWFLLKFVGKCRALYMKIYVHLWSIAVISLYRRQIFSVRYALKQILWDTHDSSVSLINSWAYSTRDISCKFLCKVSKIVTVCVKIIVPFFSEFNIQGD